MIRIDSLTHQYRRSDAPALNALSCTITPGSITGLIGPNGSGKTTLTRVLAGHLQPTAGSILYGSTEATPEARLATSVFTDQGESLGDASASNVLAFARQRSTWDEATFGRLTKRFNLDVRRRLKRRSRGQRALFSACIGLASGAPITLFDEVTATLDVSTRLALHGEIIAAAAKDERTFVISSHLVAELEPLIEDVIVINHGEAILHRPVEDFRTSVTAFVADPEFAQVIAQQVSDSDASQSARVLSTKPVGRLAEYLVLDAPPALSDRAVSAGIHTYFPTFQDTFVALTEEDFR